MPFELIPAFTFPMGLPSRYPFRVFPSVVPYKGGWIGLIREHDPDSPSWQRTDLRIVIYDKDRRLISDQYFCHGEDPRCFLHSGHPYALIYDFNGDTFRYALLDLIARTIAYLESDVDGKNFVPLVDLNVAHGDKPFYVIQNLCPLIISRLEPQTGTLTRTVGAGAKIQRGNVGPWRGGTPAYRIGDKLIGYGHQSVSFDIHRVFRWEYDTNDPRAEIGVRVLSNNKSLMDPTSLWVDPVTGDDMILVGEVGFRWSVTQPSRAVAYRVKEVAE